MSELDTSNPILKKDSPDVILNLLGRINRTVLQEENLEVMLRAFCNLLATLREYLFSWVALSDEDARHFSVVASSGNALPWLDFEDDGDPSSEPACALAAIRSRSRTLISENEDEDVCRSCPFRRAYPHRSTLALPLKRQERLLGILVIHAPEPGVFNEKEQKLLQDLADNLAYSIEKIQTSEQQQQATKDLQTLQKITEISLGSTSLKESLPQLADTLHRAMKTEKCCLSIWDPNRKRVSASTSISSKGINANGFCPSPEAVIAILGKDETQICQTDGFPVKTADEKQNFNGPLALPLRAHGRSIGVAYLHSQNPAWACASTIRRAEKLVGHLALALEHMQTIQANSRRIDTLMALHETGLDLSNQLEIRPLLESIVARAAQLMNSPWGGLYLRVPEGLRLVVAQGLLEDRRGYTLPEGQGASGKAAAEGRIIVVDDYRTWPGQASAFGKVDVGSVIAAPIVWRDELLGVFHVEHPEPKLYGTNEMELISLFSEQAAVAIVNTRLIDGLERARRELESAYDATLQGWVRALDLRDEETEGHTQRVTNLSMRLARELGMNDETALENIRRGALLHDIGKIGIPDSILKKPGKLTEEEWVIMRRHPRLAWDMLSPTEYLKPCLAIPFCHHEWYDGSGYPQGIAGDEIPIEARIFSIVDVWDALRSDRPYRAGWPKSKVIEHLKSRRGTHFDPEILDRFLQMIGLEAE